MELPTDLAGGLAACCVARLVRGTCTCSWRAGIILWCVALTAPAMAGTGAVAGRGCCCCCVGRSDFGWRLAPPPLCELLLRGPRWFLPPCVACDGCYGWCVRVCYGCYVATTAPQAGVESATCGLPGRALDPATCGAQCRRRPASTCPTLRPHTARRRATLLAVLTGPAALCTWASFLRPAKP